MKIRTSKRGQVNAYVHVSVQGALRIRSLNEYAEANGLSPEIAARVLLTAALDNLQRNGA